MKLYRPGFACLHNKAPNRFLPIWVFDFLCHAAMSCRDFPCNAPALRTKRSPAINFFVLCSMAICSSAAWDHRCTFAAVAGGLASWNELNARFGECDLRFSWLIVPFQNETAVTRLDLQVVRLDKLVNRFPHSLLVVVVTGQHAGWFHLRPPGRQVAAHTFV